MNTFIQNIVPFPWIKLSFLVLTPLSSPLSLPQIIFFTEILVILTHFASSLGVFCHRWFRMCPPHLCSQTAQISEGRWPCPALYHALPRATTVLNIRRMARGYEPCIPFK